MEEKTIWGFHLAELNNYIKFFFIKIMKDSLCFSK